ncbi:Lrp/AsnC family transcriptional regulator [Streptomyces boluensis]|uniref:AsnC family transcriptional regulator n=1 Tax=Streptomyces boluensis TaxID=1775135 RepID=A0A964UQM8_9ACTN|nr:Lrp/AsnC family transcriptional regulator [Streptomyces boluensis]NBE53639.1 AsnC family transcriptional regulator [Streptomyces boluensis]
MQDHVTLDELDLQLVNALQIQPRAPWALVGKVLGLDPVTAARRWARLTRAGAAWVSCYPPETERQSTAFIEIVCEPGHSLAVARELAQDPQAMTVDVTAGDRDVFVTLHTPDEEVLADYLLERLGGVRHLHRVRSHLQVKNYIEASRWRLRTLDRAQISLMTPEPAEHTPTLRPLTDEDWAIAVTLAADGRASLDALAAAASVSVSTARRRLNRMLADQQVRMRCELARPLTGWPVYAWFFARVAPEHMDAAGHALARLPEVRAVMGTAGPYNLIVAVWLRSLPDVQQLEIRISRTLPSVDIVDRSVTIRPLKLVGRLLDKRGYAAGTVPLDTRRLSGAGNSPSSTPD